ncbi:hypothetical protein [Rhodoflexus caldus]|uniref:hypothetical protein n=1 Tax=Rhodoflexus caldus TaxID=2891236 RepID=UPI00202A37BF|nr:hypothetical protein [Rhodoflexus caldus]
MISLLNVECRADGNCYGTERLPSGSGRTHSFTRSQIGQYNIQTWSPNTVWQPQNATTTMNNTVANTVIRPLPTLQAGVGNLALPTIDIGQHYAQRQTEIKQSMTDAQKRINAETASIFEQSLKAQIAAANAPNLGGGVLPSNPGITQQGLPSWAIYAAGALVLLIALFFLMKK